MKISFNVDTSDGAGLNEAIETLQKLGGSAPAATKATKPAAKKTAAKKAAPKEEPAAEPEAEETSDPDGPTLDEVRAKLKEYAALEGKENAIQILKDNGASSIGELDESKYAAVIAAAE